MNSGKEDFRVGILGFGGRGLSLIGPILNNSLDNRITVGIDPDIKRSRFFLEEEIGRGGIPREEAEKIRFVSSLEETRPGEFNVLLLTASERVRSLLFADAVKTGAHIWMEKGLAADLEGAAKVVDGLRHQRPGQQIFMGFNFRHNPGLAHAQRLIRQGRIGRVLSINYQEQIRFAHGASFYGRFHRDVKQSGGMLVTKSCHDLDMIGFLVGARPGRVFSAQYKQLFGKGGPEAREYCHTCDRASECEFDIMRKMHTRAEKRRYSKVYLDEDKATTDGYFLDACCWRDDTELKDLSQVLIEYENGVVANYTQLLFAPYENRVLQVFGDRGAIYYDQYQRSFTLIDRWHTRTEKFEFPLGPKGDGHGGADTGVINAFFESIRTGVPSDSTIADGVWALAVAEAAYESHDKRAWVDVRPLVEKVGPGLD